MSGENQTIDYGEYMALPFSERLLAFGRISAENRARLKKTHLTRFLAANRERLTSTQIEMVEAIAAFISPEMYRGPGESETFIERAEALRRQAEIVFADDDVRLIFSDRAERIPPPDI